MTTYIYNDGGRLAAGHSGTAADCVTRSIAIHTGKPYAEIWDKLAAMNKAQNRPHTADRRIITFSAEFRALSKTLGLEPTAFKKPQDFNKTVLPANCIAQISGHWFAIKDGVINDTYNPTPGGRAKVLGYWVYKSPTQFYNVFKGGAKLNVAPLNAQQAATMKRLFELNYGSNLTIHEI